jgi:5-hydroxyisourate hydrolase
MVAISLLPSTLNIGKISMFKLTLYTREYFNAKGLESIFPHVEIMCEVTEPEENHHIALILGPYSYTVYIGS